MRGILQGDARMFEGLYGRAMVVQPDDLTAKARIRESALELFAANGIAATSMRSIAAHARVSPSLVVHHYRSKGQLRAAVDEAVVDAFAASLAVVDASGTPEAVARALQDATTGLISADPQVRAYVARSIAEPNPASQALFDAMVDLLERCFDDLDARGYLNPHIDPVWRSYTGVFIVLGPILLGSQIQARLGLDPFAPDVLEARSTCSTTILAEGLFRRVPA